MTTSGNEDNNEPEVTATEADAAALTLTVITRPAEPPSMPTAENTTGTAIDSLADNELLTGMDRSTAETMASAFGLMSVLSSLVHSDLKPTNVIVTPGPSRDTIDGTYGLDDNNNLVILERIPNDHFEDVVQPEAGDAEADEKAVD